MNRSAFLLVIVLACIAPRAFAQASYDQQVPFGFATCTSRTSAGSFTLNGGGGWLYDNGQVKNAAGTAVSTSKVTVLTSNGRDMKSAIETAIKNYSVVVLDGSQGDFIISSVISLSGVKNKTLLGINNARLCTQWYMTPQLAAMLDTVRTASGKLGVKNASTSSGGGMLHGEYIKEECEYLTRRTLYNFYGNENYINAGILALGGCSNIIIRNLKFVGPGSVDVGGKDLLGCSSSTVHVWVDHCDFTDGIDGNFDITQKADFFTVSWCTFSYTSRAYNHMNSNLVGSSDSEATGYLNTTYSNNVWGAGCNQRMPMGRVGKIHMLNNYYCCAGASCCINPRINSEFLIEGNYFASGVKNVFSQSGATAYVWSATNKIISSGVTTPKSSGSVSLPYSYTAQPADSVKNNFVHAGATLYGSSAPAWEDIQLTDNHYVVANADQVHGGQQVMGLDITMTFGASTYNAASAQTGVSGYGYCLTGTDNPVVSNNIPSSGTYYHFRSSVAGQLQAAVVIGAKDKVLKVSKNGTLVGYKLDGVDVPSSGYAAAGREAKMLALPIVAGTDYFVFASGSKLGLMGWLFTPDHATSLSITPPDLSSLGDENVQGHTTMCWYQGRLCLRTEHGLYDLLGQKCLR